MEQQKLVIIRTIQGLIELKQYLQDKEYVAFDIESDGTAYDKRVIGFSISAEPYIGYYVILSYWDVEKQELIDIETKQAVEDFLVFLKTRNLIMHNGIFDSRLIQTNFNVSLIESLHTDTLMLAHLLNENRPNGLKELGSYYFGDDIKKEQEEMKESVLKNKGKLTKEHYELYKADADLIAKYGAKDSILTLNLFYLLVEQLYAQNLEKFFYEEETMPLLRGPTYHLNTVGLKVDVSKLQDLKAIIEAECMELNSFINKEVSEYVKDLYPGTNKKNVFNISSNTQLAWLLFHKLDNDFSSLTEAGKELCKELQIRAPYTRAEKRDFIQMCASSLGRVYSPPIYNPKTGKYGRAKTIKEFWKYTSTDEESLSKYKDKYMWLDKLLKYKENQKLLNTYVIGIQDRVKYGVVRPRFFQNGTTSGRYSSADPNFQNLPRNDKRIKSCIISRPEKVFVGADYAQLEPRVFASISQDEKLMSCFENKQDFYSVVGIPIFEKYDTSANKKDSNSFADKHPELRDVAKAFALATPYGTSAYQQSRKLHRPVDECRMIIDRYFESYPKVELMMLQSHEEAKSTGVVYSLYGRPRRIPDAINIPKIYGPNKDHSELPYEARTLLNLAMNHRVQSSAASIVNRATIAFYDRIRGLKIEGCNIILQIHDEIVVECYEKDAPIISGILKECMETTTTLPGVKLEAVPKIANNIADLK